MPLNPKQRSFVTEYLLDKNATRAAIDAGYSKRSAASQAFDLLKKPEIARAIEEALSRSAKKAELKAADVLAEIRKLAFVDLSKAYDKDGKFLPMRELPEEVKAALSSVEVDEIFVGRGTSRTKVGVTRKVKLTDKVRALEMLAKHFKLLTEMHELSGKGGAPIAFIALPANGSEAPEHPSPATAAPLPPEKKSD